MLLSMLIFNTVSHASDIRCYTSDGGKSKVIHLKLYLPENNLSMANVKYENSIDGLDLFRIKVETLPPKNAVPAVVRITFIEIVENNKTGSYELTTVGARAPELIYKNFAKKSRYKFYEDESRGDLGQDSCVWETH